MNGTNGNLYAQEPTLYGPDEDFAYPVERDCLEKVVPTHSEPEDESTKITNSVSYDPFGDRGDPGTQVLTEGLAPGRPDLHVQLQIGLSPVQEPSSDTVMTEQAEETEATEAPDLPLTAASSIKSEKTAFEAKLHDAASHGIFASVDRNELQETASASLQECEATTQGKDVDADNVSEKRHDSHQEPEDLMPPDKDQSQHCRESPSLTLDIKRASNAEESIATSPILSKHVLSISNDRPETLPAFQHHPHTGDDSVGSPHHSASLPSIHQIVPAQQYQPLNELANIATQNDHRTMNHSSPPLSSTFTLSPGIPYHPYPGSAQMSPSSQHIFSARSPTSGYGSPPNFSQHVPYYTSRRSSAPTDRARGPPPSIPSVSSSGESHGHASSVEGYSTAHTTPIEFAGAPTPILPPPAGMVVAPGYKCDAPDCNAPPFQTQYLLSSHKNVHTTARPHFCPVMNCPRGEGGKGFKRKNEMIRHGLVHESPGYVCPFCPDREHRYPRPDNLQRHVRVHHMDVSKDDPELRMVLARTQSNGKTRRRRANTAGSAT